MEKLIKIVKTLISKKDIGRTNIFKYSFMGIPAIIVVRKPITKNMKIFM